jgi:ribonuclease HI
MSPTNLDEMDQDETKSAVTIRNDTGKLDLCDILSTIKRVESRINSKTSGTITTRNDVEKLDRTRNNVLKLDQLTRNEVGKLDQGTNSCQKITSKLFQWNINGLFAHFEDLRILADEENPAIIALQETHLKKGQELTFRGFKIISKPTDSNRAKHGSALLIRDGIHFKEIDLDSDLSAVAATVVLHKKITICSLYLPPSTDVTKTKIDKLIRQLPRPYIITGDLNAHSQMWGSRKSTKRGLIIEKVIDERNLNVANNGEGTHVVASTGRLTCIDITLMTPDLTPGTRWYVHHDTGNSDHFPTVLELLDDTISTSKRANWRITHANWERFQEQVENTIINIDRNLSSLEMTSIIIDSALNNIPRTSTKTRNKHIPWMTEEIRQLKKDRRRAERLQRTHPSLENLIALRKCRAKLRYTMKMERKKSFKSYVDNITSQTPTSQIWGKISSLSGKRNSNIILRLRKPNGDIITNPKNMADEMAFHFKSVSSTSNYPTAFQKFKEVTEKDEIEIDPNSNEEEYNQIFSMAELDLALSNCSGSSPGPDHIHYDMLKNLANASKAAVLNMYNQIWISQEIPAEWKEATVIPILKKGKDPLNPNSYRPISLTSCLCKVFERMINGRLVHLLETRNQLPSQQWGFRKQRSTEDVLAILSTEICDAFREKKHIVLTSLDLSKAYDMCWRYGIVKTVKSLNIDGRMLGNIKNFMSDRVLRVAVGAQLSDPVTVENGVPQGAVLSVTLFLVALANLDKDIKKPTKTIGYADDWILYTKSSRLRKAETTMQRALDSLGQWSRQTGFSFSAEKTVVMLFTKLNNERRDLNLRLGGMLLENVPNHRILGVIFDDRLNWMAHINDVKARSTKKLSLLKALASTNWGADRNVMLRVHEMTILATLRYGEIAYSSACKTTLEKLDPVHHKGVRLALGTFCVSNNLNVLCEAGIPTLETMRDTKVMMKAVRIAANITHPLSIRMRVSLFDKFYDKPSRMPKPLDVRAKLLLAEIGLRPVDTQKNVTQHRPYWKSTRRERIDTSLMSIQNSNSNERTQAEFLELIQNKYQEHLQIYTDGSLANGRTGCAAVLPNETIARRLTDITTVFNAEQQAIIEGIGQTKGCSQKLLIVSDSLSCLTAVSQMQVNAEPKTRIIANMMDENENINLLWVPGHRGVRGNEEADQAAKQSLSFHQPNHTYTTANDTIKHVKKWVKDKIQRQWISNQRDMRMLKPTTERFDDTNGMKRREQVVIGRLRIGYTRMTHGYKVNRENPPQCIECQTLLTTNHFLWECSKYDGIRRSSGLTNEDFHNTKEGALRVLNFVRETGLFDEI